MKALSSCLSAVRQFFCLHSIALVDWNSEDGHAGTCTCGAYVHAADYMGPPF